jgi:hypothetical protein
MVNAQLGRRAARTRSRAKCTICLDMISAQTRFAFVARYHAPITLNIVSPDCRLVLLLRFKVGEG